MNFKHVLVQATARRRSAVLDELRVGLSIAEAPLLMVEQRLLTL